MHSELCPSAFDSQLPRVCRALCFAVAAISLQACAPLAVNEPRASESSLGCMKASIAGHDLSGRDDREAHCIAAGLIARRCSLTEAWLASYGKELQDLLGRGDAEWRDLRSDFAGIRCARSATDPASLSECCAHRPSAD
jgi:hypothetical protein